MTGVVDDGVESTSRGDCGGRMEVAPMGWEVDEVVMERLHEGRRLWTMGGGGGGSRIRPRWAGMVKLWWPLLLSLLLASVEAQQKESYGGKKKLFPRKSGKYPGRGGKKLDSKTLDN